MLKNEIYYAPKEDFIFIWDSNLMLAWIDNYVHFSVYQFEIAVMMRSKKIIYLGDL